MCVMYKLCNNPVRDNISDSITPFVREVSNYPLLNGAKIYMYIHVKKFQTDIVSRLCLTRMICSLI